MGIYKRLVGKRLLGWGYWEKDAAWNKATGRRLLARRLLVRRLLARRLLVRRLLVRRLLAKKPYVSYNVLFLLTHYKPPWTPYFLYGLLKVTLKTPKGLGRTMAAKENPKYSKSEEYNDGLCRHKIVRLSVCESCANPRAQTDREASIKDSGFTKPRLGVTVLCLHTATWPERGPCLAETVWAGSREQFLVLFVNGSNKNSECGLLGRDTSEGESRDMFPVLLGLIEQYQELE